MTRQIPAVPLEHAIRIVTRRHSGSWSDREESELQVWLAAATSNRAAYDRVERMWGSAGGLASRVVIQAGARPTRPSRAKYYALAASLCAVVIGAFLFTPAFHATRDWWVGVPVHLSAQSGTPREMTLQDGTKVLLDADSELVVQLGARARHVSLLRGEALFTVVHDAARPFELDAGPGRITDLGTRFDVEALEGEVRVAVLEGRVGLSTRDGKVSLEAGSAGGYDSEGSLLSVRTAGDSVALWREGERRFDSERLIDVLERFKRYHAVTFVFSDPQLKQLRVSGTFRMDNLALFLRTLDAALPISTHWIGPQTVQIDPRSSQSKAITTSKDQPSP